VLADMAAPIADCFCVVVDVAHSSTVAVAADVADVAVANVAAAVAAAAAADADHAPCPLAPQWPASDIVRRCRPSLIQH